MARKTATVTIDADGRDQGKLFFLTEMATTKADKWATRFLLAVSKGVEIPEGIAQSGIAGVAAVGFGALGRLEFSDAEPLLDALMACVEIIPDPSRPMVKRYLVEDDIEEVITLLRLRKELFELHTGFSLAAALSGLISGSQTGGSSITPTSPDPSAPSSQAG